MGMECYKKIGLLLCVMTISLQSCVRNDLDECPPAVRYALNFEYTIHPERNIDGTPINRFVEDVDRMYVFAFDSTGTCMHADTTLTGPFSEGLTYSLPLNVGRYTTITTGWGRDTGDPNLHRSTAVIPRITVGETNIREVRLILEDVESSVHNVDGKIEKTFYGENEINIVPFSNRVDTVPLMNIANMIRIIVIDANKLENWQSMELTIDGDNGAYSFFGSPVIRAVGVLGRVKYKPFGKYYTDSIAVKDPINLSRPSPGSGSDPMLVFDISTLRLIEGDRNLKVNFEWEGRIIEFELVTLITEAIPSGLNKQYELDSNFRWQIEFNLTETAATANVIVENWRVIQQDTGLGGILQ
jgi:tetrahydromethanopterin S-methyltransferase subunit G